MLQLKIKLKIQFLLWGKSRWSSFPTEWMSFTDSRLLNLSFYDGLVNLYPHPVLCCSRRLWARVWQNIALFTLCLVGAVVFFIAATVVLSLIPLYLARRAVDIETISKFDLIFTLLILSHRITHLVVAKGPYPLQYQASAVSTDSLAGIDLNSFSTEVILSHFTLTAGVSDLFFRLDIAWKEAESGGHSRHCCYTRSPAIKCTSETATGTV